MRHSKSILALALPMAFTALPALGDVQELKLPDLNVYLQQKWHDVQKATTEKAPTGESLLRIENKEPKAFCEFSFHKKMKLESFDVLELAVNLDRSRTSELQNFSIRIMDATGEMLQYTLTGETITKGDTILFKLGRTQKPTVSWGGNKDGKIDQPAQLFGGAFRFRDGVGAISLRSFTAKTLVPYATTPTVELRNNANGFAFFQPDKDSGALFVHNSNATPIDATLAYRIVKAGATDSVSTQTLPLSLAANESIQVPFKIPAELGLYEIKSTLSLKGRSDSGMEKTARFAAMIPAVPGERSGGEFLFGICCQHLPKISPVHAEKEIAASAYAGAQIVRFCSYWDVLEPKHKQWNFASLDRVFQLMEQYGLESQVLHSRLPNWATAADWKSIRQEKQGKAGRPLPDFDAWRNFVRTFARRYSGKTLHTEIWNEPDLYSFADFSTEDYLKMLKIAAEETRANDPGTKLLSGGFATIPATNWTGGNAEIAERTMSEGKNDYDIFALHNHSLLPSCVAVLNRFDEMRARNNDKKEWYMNESGLTTRGSTEWEQACTLFRKVLYSWSRGAVAFNWYNLRNDGWDQSNGEHNFGLLLNDYQPKQSYLAFNMLTTHYSGGKFLRVMEETAEGTSLLFRDTKGDYLVATFLNRKDERSRIAILSGITGKVEKIDLFGNVQELPVQNGVLTFEQVPEPYTLKISGNEPIWVGELIQLVENPGLYRDQNNRLTVELKNPTNTELTCRFRMDTPATLSVKSEVDALRIPAQSTAKVTFLVRPTMEHDASIAGKVMISFGELGEFPMELPSDYIRSLSRRGFAKTPDFVLDNRDQLSIQVPSAPEFEPLVWKGPQDLSAKVYLAAAKNELKLRVEVTDDIHVQQFRGDALWQGDSVQFVISPEDAKGYWRFGLSLDSDNKPEVFLWDVPAGKSSDAMIAATRLVVTRNEAAKTTVYEATLPMELLEISGKLFRFNLLVNDNDGKTRESFISVAPGLGRNFDVRIYPLYKDDQKE